MEQAGFTTRCAWCGKIKFNGGWNTERRKRPVSYTDTICPACKLRDFPKQYGKTMEPK